jgi:arginyl-tRNA synthetase
MKFHAGETPPPDDITRWMGDLYAEADRRLSQNPDLESEVRNLFARWDRRDPEVVELWVKSRQWSLDGFEQMYRQLGVRFDRVYFESEVEDHGKTLVDDLISRGIAVDERPEGPVIVRLDDLLGLEKEKYRVLVVLRSDGTSLYATKDLYLAILKNQDYALDRSIYVIDVRQAFYMQQIFKTLEIMGYPWAKDCYHLAYEIVNLPGNVVISSRDGTVVLLEDLIREATRRAMQIVEEKNPELTNAQKEEVSHAVALGALRYTMLARDNTKTVTFDWESALDFNGQAAPYVQYAHVRACSILRRLEAEGEQLELSENLSPEGFSLHPTEIQLVDLISRLPGEIQRAAAEFKPLHLTNLAYELARAFTDFYNACPVLKAEPEVRTFRTRLVAATRYALANSLKVLGIHAPEYM